MTPGMRSSTANYVSLAPGQQRPGRDAILPAVLEFREETEREFFNALTFGLDPGLASFKLAPTYTIYMATRYLTALVRYALHGVKGVAAAREHYFFDSA